MKSSRKKPINMILILSCVLMIFSCKSKPEDTTFKIFHLKPNKLIINKDTLNSYGWYSKSRNDFFVIKNFDLKSEQHKMAIDSFIINYLEKDPFLHQNKNASWTLTFFKYGDDLDETTVHEYNTDYTMHTLFAPKKEICQFVFNNRFGYNGSYYVTDSITRKLDKNKRQGIMDYFKNRSF